MKLTFLCICMTPKHEKIYSSNRKRHLIAKRKNIMIYLESIDVKTKAYIFGSIGTNGCFNTNRFLFAIDVQRMNYEVFLSVRNLSFSWCSFEIKFRLS